MHSNPKTYPAPVVDDILDSVLGVMQDTLVSYKEAASTIQELEGRTPKVVLEKVASSLDPDLVDETVALLERHSFTDPRDAGACVKLASFLKEDPNNVLHLMKQVINFSSANPEEGRGVEKRAAAKSKSHESRKDYWEEDGFDKILREGA